ncbi:hypothetical protein RB195_000480 [Necator americanus]|uniref:Uncharacterized protein n=1 Tax=Necator americanus TaxID=51031 RepID=A0ABR1D9Y5_NECAM
MNESTLVIRGGKTPLRNVDSVGYVEKNPSVIHLVHFHKILSVPPAILHLRPLRQKFESVTNCCSPASAAELVALCEGLEKVSRNEKFFYKFFVGGLNAKLGKVRKMNTVSEDLDWGSL